MRIVRALPPPAGVAPVSPAVAALGALKRGVLHEVHTSDSHAVSGVALAALLARQTAGKQAILWLCEAKARRRLGRLYAPGLAELGIAWREMSIVEAPDAKALLRAAGDAALCADVAAVVVEACGRQPLIDLTATRRLALRAAECDGLVLLLRIGAEEAPSAAWTRWRVAPAPSLPPENDDEAPGSPVFDVDLLRHRGGVQPARARVEWNYDRRTFIDAPLSGGGNALVGERAADREWASAA